MHAYAAQLAIAALVAAGSVAAVNPVTAAASSTPTARCGGHPASIVGRSGGQTLTGTPGDDVIAGLGGNDNINGRGGNDIICGGAGTDHLNGGAGDDTLYGGKDAMFIEEGQTDRVGDSLRGGSGNDTLRPGHDGRVADEVAPDAYLFDTSPRAVHVDVGAGTATGNGHDRFDGRDIAILGSRYADVLVGSSGPDYLNGGPGSDSITGRGGNDRIIGDSGGRVRHNDDTLVGGKGDDDMSATIGEDVFRGGPGNDVMDDIGKSADVMVGGSGDDLVIGELWETAADQVFDGGRGSDHLSLLSSEMNPNPDPATGTWDMRTGIMHFTFQTPLDITATGFEKADFATWGATWTVDGTDGPNEIFAGGSTTFYGHGGDDTFMGSPAPDTFDGGDGTDHALAMGVGPGDSCISVEVFDYDDCDSVTT